VKRGPLPKSADVDELEGNPGSRSRKPPPRFGAAKVRMRPPAHLAPMAKTFWGKHYEALRLAGTLTTADLHAFEMLCQAYARWRDAEGQLATMGAYVKLSNGNMGVNPFFRVCRQCADEVRAAMADFGLTPPSRARLAEYAPTLPPMDRPLVGGRFAHLIGSNVDDDFTGLIGKAGNQ
jgi:P27 family predicted phage terminase small subunit